MEAGSCIKEGQFLPPPVEAGESLPKYVKGNTKTLVFPAVSVEYSDVLRSKKGVKWTEREWKVGVDENKVRKAKFCRRLQSGCLQVVDVFPTGEYLKKVEAEQKKLNEKKKKLKETV